MCLNVLLSSCYSVEMLHKNYVICYMFVIVASVNIWILVLYTVLAVNSVSEEDVQSGVYRFPANSDINGNYPAVWWLL